VTRRTSPLRGLTLEELMRLTRFLIRPRSASPLFVAALLTVPITQPRNLDPLRTSVVTGRVTDSVGQPMAAANVSIVARNLSTVTSTDGRYSLVVARAVDREQVTLRVARIGYQARTMSVYLSCDTVRADVRLTTTIAQLNEVVATSVGDAASVQLRAAPSSLGAAQPLRMARKFSAANEQRNHPCWPRRVR